MPFRIEVIAGTVTISCAAAIVYGLLRTLLMQLCNHFLNIKRDVIVVGIISALTITSLLYYRGIYKGIDSYGESTIQENALSEDKGSEELDNSFFLNEEFHEQEATDAVNRSEPLIDTENQENTKIALGETQGSENYREEVNQITSEPQEIVDLDEQQTPLAEYEPGQESNYSKEDNYNADNTDVGHGKGILRKWNIINIFSLVLLMYGILSLFISAVYTVFWVADEESADAENDRNLIYKEKYDDLREVEVFTLYSAIPIAMGATGIICDLTNIPLYSTIGLVAAISFLTMIVLIWAKNQILKVPQKADGTNE